jgi:hypothetical protein
MKYTFTFGRNSQLIWVMILPAFILLIPLLLAIEYIIPLFPISDWTSIILTLVYFGFVLLSTLYLVNLIRVTVEVTVNSDYIDFYFIKRNWFHKADFTLHFEDLLSVSEDNDKGYDFIYFKTKNSVYPKFHLMEEENNPDFESFKNQLYAGIDSRTENEL